MVKCGGHRPKIPKFALVSGAAQHCEPSFQRRACNPLSSRLPYSLGVEACLPSFSSWIGIPPTGQSALAVQVPLPSILRLPPDSAEKAQASSPKLFATLLNFSRSPKIAVRSNRALFSSRINLSSPTFYFAAKKKQIKNSVLRRGQGVAQARALAGDVITVCLERATVIGFVVKRKTASF